MSQYRGYFVPGAVDPFGTICLKKKCGVESMVVTWNKADGIKKLANAGYSLSKDGTVFFIEVVIKFKKDKDHDPALCAYYQDAGTWLQFKSKTGTPVSTFPLDDDGYSRADDTDGNKKLDDPSFTTNDLPGFGVAIKKGVRYRYIFVARQYVTDINTGKIVAETERYGGTLRGPKPVWAVGSFPRNADYINRAKNAWTNKFDKGLKAPPGNPKVTIH